MFRDTRRKKLRNQVILAALAVSLMTFGIWLNYKTVVDQDGSERGDTSAKQPAADTAEEEESYYIKEVDGVVKVFACQGEEKKLYLITSIPFELLSQTDQNMFSKGVTKKTKAELDEFLENFDS